MSNSSKHCSEVKEQVTMAHLRWMASNVIGTAILGHVDSMTREELVDFGHVTRFLLGDEALSSRERLIGILSPLFPDLDIRLRSDRTETVAPDEVVNGDCST